MSTADLTQITQVAGFAGALVAGGAYVPQIWHLIAERCSAGLSRLAFAAWLASSLLVTSHAIATGAGVFVALGLTQVTATTVILVYATRFAHLTCDSHRCGEVATVAPPQPPAEDDEHVASGSQGAW